MIDSFKQEICASLEEYNTKIESLRKEMEDYTLSTEAVQVCFGVSAAARGLGAEEAFLDEIRLCPSLFSSLEQGVSGRIRGFGPSSAGVEG